MERHGSPSLDHSLEEIERAILPNVGLLLDCLLDAAETARSGTGSARPGGELKILARHISDLTRQIESATSAQLPEPVRMSA